MNNIFSGQKDKLISLRQEISLLRQQIDFLLRNENALGTLDLDVLLNRTRSIYEQLCAIGIEEEPVEEVENGKTDRIGAKENVEQHSMEPDSKETVDVALERAVDNEPDVAEPIEKAVQNVTDSVQHTADPLHDEEEVNAFDSESIFKSTEDESNNDTATVSQPLDFLELSKPTSETSPERVGADMGFLFKLADEPGTTEIIDNKVVHYIDQIPESEISEQDLKDMEPHRENLFEMPVMEQGQEDEADSLPSQQKQEQTEDSEDKESLRFIDDDNLFDYEKQERRARESEGVSVFDHSGVPETIGAEKSGNTGFLFDISPLPAMQEPLPDKDVVEQAEMPTPLIIKPTLENDPAESEVPFELEETTALADKMQHDDDSLAARLNRKPLDSLKSAIGINDKFLFVNELFGGSMEKFNKSIDNLNDLKTLNGALIYLNELKIELQWNSSNEAYRKLSDLVSRKFE